MNKILKRVRLSLLVLTAILLVATEYIPAKAAPPIPLNIHFETAVSGLNLPVFATHAGDGSGRLFIVERGGTVQILKNGSLLASPFLDIHSLVAQDGGEQGLLGLAFAPDYSSSGNFYIYYTALDYAVTLARYKVSADADIADAASAQILLSISKTATNHNGGMLAFGPDGFLYMGTGDGGGAGDTANNAQNRQSLLGKILRIDVSGGGAYHIPTSNPYFNNANGYRQEIWAYGLRNPWRWSFDRSAGDLYIADVGQNVQEEIDFQPAAGSGGLNYGWHVKEGNLCYNPLNCAAPENYSAPVAVYDHGTNDSNGCAVTGGYVYRGTAFPGLVGTYLYGDFCTGKLWGMARNTNNQWVNTLITDTGYNISSFGEDENGEMYLLDYNGSLLRITRAATQMTPFTSTAAYDGYIRESSETSGKGGVLNASSYVFVAGDSTDRKQYRGLLSFNTSSLPDGAIVTSARLILKLQRISGTNPFTSHGGLLIDIRKPFFGTARTLGLDDFNAAASLGAAGSVGKTPNNGVYTGSISTSGLAYINKTGTTQLRLRFQKDDNNNNIADYLAFFSGDASNAENRPVLQVTYFMP